MFVRRWRVAGRLLISAAAATTALVVASTAGATPTVPHVSAAVQQGWQFPVPGWSSSDKEAGRVDDILRVHHTVFIAGNFTTAADHNGNVQQRSYLAAEDAVSGALLPFAPVL